MLGFSLVCPLAAALAVSVVHTWFSRKKKEKRKKMKKTLVAAFAVSVTIGVPVR